MSACDSQPITVGIGNTYSSRLTIKVNGVATDITGFTFNFVAKERDVDFVDVAGDIITTDAVINKSISPTDPTNGIVDLILTGTDTAVTAGEYLYRFYMTNTTDNRTLLLENNLIVED